MTYHHIQWDNDEKTVVLQSYERGSTKSDLYQLAEKSNKMLASVPHRVHLIIDERNIKLLLTTSDIKYLEKMTPKNQGAVVMILPKLELRYKKLVNDMAVTVAPHAFGEPYFVETIEQAREFLQTHFNVTYEVADKS